MVCKARAPAKVVDEQGHGTARELLVHYNGWNKRLDEWIGVCSGRLRAEDGKQEPSKSEGSHEEGDGQRRSASAPKTCAGDAVTAAARAPSAPPPDAIDPTHAQTLEEPQASLIDRWLAVPTEGYQQIFGACAAVEIYSMTHDSNGDFKGGAGRRGCLGARWGRTSRRRAPGRRARTERSCAVLLAFVTP